MAQAMKRRPAWHPPLDCARTPPAHRERHGTRRGEGPPRPRDMPSGKRSAGASSMAGPRWSAWPYRHPATRSRGQGRPPTPLWKRAASWRRPCAGHPQRRARRLCLEAPGASPAARILRPMLRRFAPWNLRRDQVSPAPGLGSPRRSGRLCRLASPPCLRQPCSRPPPPLTQGARGRLLPLCRIVPSAAWRPTAPGDSSAKGMGAWAHPPPAPDLPLVRALACARLSSGCGRSPTAMAQRSPPGPERRAWATWRGHGSHLLLHRPPPLRRHRPWRQHRAQFRLPGPARGLCSRLAGGLKPRLQMRRVPLRTDGPLRHGADG